MMDKSDPPYSAMPALEAADKVFEALRDRVRLAPLSQRAIERQHEWSRGYLSQILAGKISLSLYHLLAILHSLELRPADFFAEVLGQRPQADEIRERLERYDAALAELEAKGFLGASGAGPETAKKDSE